MKESFLLSFLCASNFSLKKRKESRRENEKQTREEEEEEEEEGAALGSDVWVEEELWCRSAAQIRFYHKSLKLQRRPTTVCLSDRLSVGTN